MTSWRQLWQWTGFDIVRKRSRVEHLAAAADELAAVYNRDKSRYTPEYFFKTNPWAHAAVCRIARAIAAVPVVVRRGDSPVTDDASLARLLRAPNPQQSLSDHLYLAALNLEIWGNLYLEWVIEAGQPEWYILRAGNMTVAAATPGARRYRYQVNGRVVVFEASHIIHGRYDDPTDDYYGISPLAAAMNELISAERATIYNDRFLKNGARASGILSIPGEVSDHVFERMKAQFAQERAGVENAGKTFIATNGATFAEMSQTPQEMEYLRQLQWSREAVLAALGVPPAEVGVFEYANYANSHVQKRMFWEDTLLPRLTKLAGIYTRALEQFYPRQELSFHFDLAAVQALQTGATELTCNLARQVEAGFLSINEARSKLQLPPVAGGEQPSLQPARRLQSRWHTAPPA